MSVNGYTVGRDIVVDLIGPNGPLRFKVKTGFEAKPEFQSSKVNRMDGVVDGLEVPAGWNLSWDYERQGPEIDDYFAEREAAFYRGENLQPLSVTETITEPDGKVSQYRYVNAMLKYDSAGAKEGLTTVKQKTTAFASRRIKVS